MELAKQAQSELEAHHEKEKRETAEALAQKDAEISQLKAATEQLVSQIEALSQSKAVPGQQHGVAVEETKTDCLEAKELAEFLAAREKEVILINNLSEDDAIAECIKVATTTEQKYALMRYRRLKAEGLITDPRGTDAILTDNMVQIRKASIMWKRGSGLMGRW